MSIVIVIGVYSYMYTAGGREQPRETTQVGTRLARLI